MPAAALDANPISSRSTLHRASPAFDETRLPPAFRLRDEETETE